MLQTHRITDSQTDAQTNADERFTHATVVGVFTYYRATQLDGNTVGATASVRSSVYHSFNRFP